MIITYDIESSPKEIFWKTSDGGNGKLLYGKPGRRHPLPLDEVEDLKKLVKRKNKEIEKLKQEIADLVILNISPEKEDVRKK